MFKVVCIALLALLAMHQVSAFKIVSLNVQNGVAAAPAATSTTTATSPSTSATAAAPLFNKSAYIQSISGAVNNKLRSLGTIVSQFLQAKNNFKNSLWQTVPRVAVSTTANKNLIPIYTKTVSVGVNAPSAASTTTSSTTASTGGGYTK